MGYFFSNKLRFDIVWCFCVAGMIFNLFTESLCPCREGTRVLLLGMPALMWTTFREGRVSFFENLYLGFLSGASLNVNSLAFL
jgi:hypothetical protein